MPMRQMRCGGVPVMSRPSSSTWPRSGRKCPVIRLKKVDFPAPFGPMTAVICCVSTRRLTESTATKPAKVLVRPRMSSMAPAPAPQPLVSRHQPANDAAGEREEQHQQDDAEDEGPILRVGGDLLVEPDQREGANRRSPEIIDAAEDRHDQHFGRFRPEDVIGEGAAVEDPVECA